MYHDKQPMAIRQADRHPAFLVVRMIGIWNRDREGVSKNRGSLVELNPMLSQISRALRLSQSNLIGMKWIKTGVPHDRQVLTIEFTDQ